MFGIGMPELLIILVVALLVVGPRKLPDLAKSLGKGMNEFRRATDEIKAEFSENESFKDLKDIKSSVDSVKDTVNSMNPKGLLEMDSVLEPKKPETDPAARRELLDEVAGGVEKVSEQADEIIDAEPIEAQAEPADTSAEAKADTDAPQPDPKPAKQDA